MRTNWIIEKRHADGSLDLSAPPSQTPRPSPGITEDWIAKIIFCSHPDAILDGRFVAEWPSHINPNFIARRKTW